VLFVEGTDNAFRVTLTDLTGNTAMIQPTMYALRNSSLTLAAPQATSIGAGVYRFLGSVADTNDARRISEVVMLVAQLDTTGAMVRIAYDAVARVNRAADGSIAFSHTMAADSALAHLGSGAYTVIAALIVPATVSHGDNTVAFSVPSVTFNP
jgi:hypothetical protein